MQMSRCGPRHSPHSVVLQNVCTTRPPPRPASVLGSLKLIGLFEIVLCECIGGNYVLVFFYINDLLMIPSINRLLTEKEVKKSVKYQQVPRVQRSAIAIFFQPTVKNPEIFDEANIEKNRKSPFWTLIALNQ